MTKEIPQAKTEERIEDQMQEFAEFVGEDLFPEEERDFLDLNELRVKYPRRYELLYTPYVSFLRGDRSDGLKNELSYATRIIKALNNLDKYISNKDAAAEGGVKLRPRQLSVYEDTREFLEAGLEFGLIKLPTGVGKTILFIEQARSLGLKSLVVVPTEQLIHQTHKRFEEFAPDMNVGKYYADVKEIGDNVTVITYDSLLAGMANNSLETSLFETVFYDEAHKLMGPERKRQLIENNPFPGAIRLAFTATPKYSDTKDLANEVEATIHTMRIEEAIEEKLLAGFVPIVARTGTNLRGVKVNRDGSFQEKALEKAINVEKRNRAALKLYKDAFTGKKIILNCLNLNHAREVARIFSEGGVSIKMVKGETSKVAKREQEQTLQELASGEIDGVSNVKLLIEGFDDPSAKLAFNLAPTSSIVNAEQRGGRVLRLFGNDIAIIVDFVDEVNDENFPVTFAEIAGGTAIPPIETSDGKPRGDKGEGNQATSELGGVLEGIQIDDLDIYYTTEAVTRFVRSGMEKKYKLPPENWVSIETIMSEKGVKTRGTIMSHIRVVVSEEQENDDLKHDRFNDRDGRLVTHVSPILAERLRQKIKDYRRVYDEVPDGWVSEYNFRDNLQDIEPIYGSMAIADIKKNHPDEMAILKIRGGNTLHISPKFVELVDELVERHKIEMPKDLKGAMTAHDARRLFPQKLLKELKQYLEDSEMLFEYQGGRYYSLEGVEHIRSKIDEGLEAQRKLYEEEGGTEAVKANMEKVDRAEKENISKVSELFKDDYGLTAENLEQIREFLSGWHVNTYKIVKIEPIENSETDRGFKIEFKTEREEDSEIEIRVVRKLMLSKEYDKLLRIYREMPWSKKEPKTEDHLVQGTMLKVKWGAMNLSYKF